MNNKGLDRAMWVIYISHIMAFTSISACNTSSISSRELGHMKDNDYMPVIGDPRTQPWDLLNAIERLENYTDIDPCFGTRIANNSRYPGANRRLCLYEYFRRHVSTGIDLATFIERHGMGVLLSENTLRDSDMASVTPFTHEGGWGSSFYLSMVFPDGVTFGVDIQISATMNRKRLLDIASRAGYISSNVKIRAAKVNEFWGRTMRPK